MLKKGSYLWQTSPRNKRTLNRQTGKRLEEMDYTTSTWKEGHFPILVLAYAVLIPYKQENCRGDKTMKLQSFLYHARFLFPFIFEFVNIQNRLSSLRGENGSVFGVQLLKPGCRWKGEARFERESSTDFSLCSRLANLLFSRQFALCPTSPSVFAPFDWFALRPLKRPRFSIFALAILTVNHFQSIKARKEVIGVFCGGDSDALILRCAFPRPRSAP